MGVTLSAAAFLLTLLVARRSLVRGIGCCLAFGYFFGILRANFPETASYFIFDASVVGLYCAQVSQITGNFQSRTGQHLKHWIVFLTLWPILLFFVPQQDYLVQLVGLRGNMFLLPFVLFGARLKEDEAYDLAICLATLNLVAFAVALAEYSVGLARFFPQNQITYVIFRSGDVGSAGAFRIPSIFSNAHSFGGMMVISLPWIAGAWVKHHAKVGNRNLLMGGLVAAILGVFMSAARIDFVILVVVLMVFTFSIQVRPKYRAGWVLMLIAVACVILSSDRLQRFASLNDTDFVSARLASSVNLSLFEAVAEYPFGAGLGGGGTSMPYFLEKRVSRPVLIESEIGRIQLETGIVGLAAWIAFAAWIFTRSRPAANDPWFLGKRMAWFCSLSFLMTAFIGIGLLTAVPCSAVLLMSLGWIANTSSEAQASANPRVALQDSEASVC